MDGIKKIKAVRPIDKIIWQVMGTGKGDEDDFSDINNKKQRILMRA